MQICDDHHHFCWLVNTKDDFSPSQYIHTIDFFYNCLQVLCLWKIVWSEFIKAIFSKIILGQLRCTHLKKSPKTNLNLPLHTAFLVFWYPAQHSGVFQTPIIFLTFSATCIRLGLFENPNKIMAFLRPYIVFDEKHLHIF